MGGDQDLPSNGGEHDMGDSEFFLDGGVLFPIFLSFIGLAHVTSICNPFKLEPTLKKKDQQLVIATR